MPSLKAIPILMCMVLEFAVAAPELSPFSTDGCSEFPNGTFEQNDLWLGCCVSHDKAYWLGGSYAARRLADEALQACVEQVGKPEIALLMLTGVRVGGSPYWNTRFRWGYGWQYWNGWRPRGYKELSEDERRLLDKVRDGESLLPVFDGATD